VAAFPAALLRGIKCVGPRFKQRAQTLVRAVDLKDGRVTT